nr:MAG TPA: hypothetical protein [Microviridae sp.]
MPNYSGVFTINIIHFKKIFPLRGDFNTIADGSRTLGKS